MKFNHDCDKTTTYINLSLTMIENIHDHEMDPRESITNMIWLGKAMWGDEDTEAKQETDWLIGTALGKANALDCLVLRDLLPEIGAPRALIEGYAEEASKHTSYGGAMLK